MASVISVRNLVVSESDQFAIFTVTLDAPSTSTVSVSYETVNGTAFAGTDYVAVDASLAFAPGETVKTVQVPLIEDTKATPKGDFFLDLFNATNGAVIGNTQALATIIANNEPSGTPVMSISNPVVDASAGVATFAVTLDRPGTGTVTVNYTTDAGSDTAKDFTPVSGTLAFTPGETAKTVTVQLNNGTTAVPEESFNLALSNVAGATLPNPVGTALIGPANQPTVSTPEISAANITVGEADGYAEFVVRLNAPSTSTVSVSYETVNGTAHAGTDYVAVDASLAFAPGETVKTVQVPLIEDTKATPKGDFFLDLFNATNGAVIGNTQALATIIANNEPSGTPVMSISNPVVDASAGVATFAVTLDRPGTGTVTVNYTTDAGSDTAKDFTPVSGTLAFTPGETAKTVTVQLNNGTTAVPEESFNLALSNVAGATLPNPVGTALIGPANQPTVSTPEISAANITVGEADGYAEFVVRLNAPSTSTVSVSYETANGTAHAGTDYVAVDASLTFAPGETVKTVQVPLIEDTKATPKGDFFLDLFNATNGAVIGNTQALATIIANNEPSGTPVMSISNPVVDASAGVATFAVTLDRPGTGTVTVNYTTDAGSDTAKDFTPVSGTLAFTPGETARTVTVQLNNGTTAVPEESFNLALSNVAGATLLNPVGTALIGPANQPTVSTPEISAANITVGEANGYAEFVVRLNAPSTSTVSVSYETANGTAFAGTDYVAVDASLTFAPGETVKTVQVPLIEDTKATPKGDFFLDLFNATNGAVIGNTQALATIIANNEPSGTPVMSISNPVVDASAGVATFAVTLDRPGTGTVTVNYTTDAGSDTAKDFTPVSGTLAFTPGETARTVTVQLNNGTTAVPEESFNLALSNVAGATLLNPVGTALIGPANQPTVSTPEISAANITVGEANGYAEFVVRLNAPSTSTVSVSYETANGTAHAGTDYVAVDASLTFAPGETVKTVQVPLIEDTKATPKGDFFLDLFNATNGAVIGNTQALATIIANNEPSGTPVMSISNPVVDASAGIATFAVTLDQPGTGTVTVNYTTDAGSDTAKDFTPVSGTLAFTPGETARTVTVQLNNGTTAVPEESFNLALSNVAGATLLNPVGTALIGPANQPTVSTPEISAANITVGEADGYAEFVVRLNAPSTSTVSVSYETANGTAFAGTDYVAVDASLAFAPGETVKTVQVPLIEDTSETTNETFSLDLFNPIHATIGTSSITATIQPICFLRGTRIATPAGEVQVEALSVGNLVLTARGEARRIVWIGEGRVLSTRGRRDAATPVIVKKGALTDNVPHRDLRVTKGHALYLDDVLIPVEFLVNHRSIIWDDHAQEIVLYHVELETHDVLLANGAPAESYRDDGNRWLFRNRNTGWALSKKEPCAPLLTGGSVVDALWRRLLDRAGPRPGFVMTNDPDLHIQIDGRRLNIASRHGATYRFVLPERPAQACAVSRAASPAELGVARDPRVLGVAVRRIELRQGSRLRIVSADDIRLSHGFHSFEVENDFRWTDGCGRLPAMLFDGFDGAMDLVLEIACTTQYPLLGEREAA